MTDFEHGDGVTGSAPSHGALVLTTSLPCWHESVASARTDRLLALSEDGAFIATDRPVPPGTPLFLELSLGATLGAQRAEIDAVATADSALAAPGVQGFGVRFLDLDERTREWILRTLSVERGRGEAPAASLPVALSPAPSPPPPVPPPPPTAVLPSVAPRAGAAPASVPWAMPAIAMPPPAAAPLPSAQAIEFGAAPGFDVDVDVDVDDVAEVGAVLTGDAEGRSALRRSDDPFGERTPRPAEDPAPDFLVPRSLEGAAIPDGSFEGDDLPLPGADAFDVDVDVDVDMDLDVDEAVADEDVQAAPNDDAQIALRKVADGEFAEFNEFFATPSPPVVDASAAIARAPVAVVEEGPWGPPVDGAPFDGPPSHALNGGADDGNMSDIYDGVDGSPLPAVPLVQAALPPAVRPPAPRPPPAPMSPHEVPVSLAAPAPPSDMAAVTAEVDLKDVSRRAAALRVDEDPIPLPGARPPPLPTRPAAEAGSGPAPFLAPVLPPPATPPSAVPPPSAPPPERSGPLPLAFAPGAANPFGLPPARPAPAPVSPQGPGPVPAAAPPPAVPHNPFASPPAAGLPPPTVSPPRPVPAVPVVPASAMPAPGAQLPFANPFAPPGARPFVPAAPSGGLPSALVPPPAAPAARPVTQAMYRADIQGEVDALKAAAAQAQAQRAGAPPSSTAPAGPPTPRAHTEQLFRADVLAGIEAAKQSPPVPAKPAPRMPTMTLNAADLHLDMARAIAGSALPPAGAPSEREPTMKMGAAPGAPRPASPTSAPFGPALGGPGGEREPTMKMGTAPRPSTTPSAGQPFSNPFGNPFAPGPGPAAPLPSAVVGPGALRGADPFAAPATQPMYRVPDPAPSPAADPFRFSPPSLPPMQAPTPRAEVASGWTVAEPGKDDDLDDLDDLPVVMGSAALIVDDVKPPTTGSTKAFTPEAWIVPDVKK